VVMVNDDDNLSIYVQNQFENLDAKRSLFIALTNGATVDVNDLTCNKVGFW
jgi:hypothetical protein